MERGQSNIERADTRLYGIVARRLNTMTGKEAWQKVVTELEVAPGDYMTVPRIRRDPLWFYAETDGSYIFITSARQKMPSSRIAIKRKITMVDFEVVHSYYSRWSKGEPGVRDEVRQLSRNTAYIFALIDHFNAA